ncbi:MAG TPA: hypothetical protein VF713_12550 [Thermoanaerobaculia bacterium]
MDFITDHDIALTRVLLAMQAETGLDQIKIAGVEEALAGARSSCAEVADFLPCSEDLIERIQRLEYVGWLRVDLSNPHLSVTAPGILMSGPTRIPLDAARALQAETSVERLR